MDIKFFGIKPIKLEGFRFESGFGYSKHVTLKMDKKKYFPILASQVINWGVKEPWKLTPEQVKCKIIDKEKFLYFSALTRNLCCSSKICGFTAIKLGNPPWGPYSNFVIGQVKKWKSIKIDVEWDFKAKGITDLVFDVWITKNKTGVPKETDIELMVWLDYKNLYPFGVKKEDFQDFSVLYSSVEKTEFIPHQPCGTISYFYTKNSAERIKFDMIKLILNSVKYFGIKNIKNYWIRTIDFGVEYAKNTKAEARIYKLNYDFNSAP